MTDDKRASQELQSELHLLRQLVNYYEQKQKAFDEATNLLVQMTEVFKLSSVNSTNTVDLRLILASVLKLTFRLIPAQHAHLFLYDGIQLTFGASLREGARFEKSAGVAWRYKLANEAALTGKPLVIENVDDHPDYQTARLEDSTGGALLTIPLKLGETVTGIMTFAFNEPRQFSDRDLDMLLVFGQQIAVVIENAQLHRLSQELRRQDRDYYAELNRTKDMVVDMVSHDLKNPIGIIKGYVHLLRKHGVVNDEIGQNCLQQIDHGANQMLSLITDLLDLAKLETGLEIRLEATSINEIVSQAVYDYALPAQEKNITLTASFLPDDDSLQLDQKRMQQVINNLVSNAIKYTPQDGTVHVSVEHVGTQILIKVKDSGFGIPEKDLPNLFRKFFRVKSQQHAEVEGTGLGLAIVREIVQQHHGEILVKSRFGEGSEFIVALPMPLAPALAKAETGVFNS